MILAVDAVLIGAARIELGLRLREGPEGMRVLHLRFARQHLQAHAFDARRRSREIFLDQVLIEADSFEDLRAAITLQRRNPHLRKHLE